MIKVRDVGLNWVEILNISRATQGLAPLESVTGRWIERLVKSQHSPLRFRQYYIEFDCPYWVAMHLRTHWVGVTAMDISATVIVSSRTDITKVARDPERIVTVFTVMNAQAVLNISKARLCTKASPETVKVWEDILAELYLLDPTVIDHCETSCSDCTEFKPCERSF